MNKFKWILLFAICFLTIITSIPTSLAQDSKSSDELMLRGIKVTSGAAPGYIPDRVCSMCHPKLFRSYQNVGMARSFFRPKEDRFIENFKTNTFYHKASKRYYQINPDGDTLTFKRYQLGPDEKPINIFTQKIDWIMGSGNHSRVYIYQTEEGELYQLPLAWYSQEGGFWGMSPGFDNPLHPGVIRLVRRECMFCHNAYPNVQEDSDIFEAQQVYPKELPEGTGCQRCHGPGANHVRTVFRGDFDTEKIRAAIINPKRLDPKHRKDVCYQCHMQPAVALFGIRRFGVHDYSFRPGQQLSDYLLHMDITEQDKKKSERFEINHHPYRLEQSKCFTNSNGSLSCLTCHNPHQKITKEKKPEHFRNACLTCHKVHQCPMEAKKAPNETVDCIDCHMPKRRTQDVINVVMTDHLIQRKPESEKLRLAHLEEHLPIIIDAQFMNPNNAPHGDLGELYRTVSILRAGGNETVVNRLRMLLQKLKPQEITPYLDMVRSLLGLRQYTEAELILSQLLQKYPDNEKAMEWMGLTKLSLNKPDEAEAIYKKALEMNKNNPNIQYNFGILFSTLKRYSDARERFKQTIKLRPIHYMAWFYLGNMQVNLNRLDDAIVSYKRVLEIEPSFNRGYLALARVLIKKGNQIEAQRYLNHGLHVATDPERIKKTLSEL